MAESTYTLVSVDVETTGPAPGSGELCSIGAVTLDEDLEIGEDRFYVNIEFPEIPKHNADTMKWWKQFPNQWEMHRLSPLTIKDALWRLVEWAELQVPGKPLFVAWPVGFDWSWINTYCHGYTGQNPFGYSPLCLKNYAAGVLRNPSMLMGNREEAFMPEGWLVEPEDIGFIKHHALGDAMAQAHMIQRIMRYTG